MKTLSTLLILTILPCLAAAQPDSESEAPGQLADLSLDQLLSVRLSSTNVMGVHHSHPKGEWMVGYNYMYMDMDGNRSGSSRVSERDVLAEFMVTPTKMSMEMHMLEVMYGVTDKVTLMGMLPYIRKSMDHVTRMGTRFKTETEGLGDLSLSTIYTFLNKE